jgi:hypothetical protein
VAAMAVIRSPLRCLCFFKPCCVISEDNEGVKMAGGSTRCFVTARSLIAGARIHPCAHPADVFTRNYRVDVERGLLFCPRSERSRVHASAYRLASLLVYREFPQYPGRFAGSTRGGH